MPKILAVTWSLAFPNLLVGLREGLEAGLVVTILIGAVRKLAPGRSLAAVWLGAAFAAAASLSFGAVLTFGRAELSPRAQEVFGGVTSLVAVSLVTWMIFWMRRAARGLGGEIRGRVGTALLAGGPALVVTAFVAVAREGLEAALFVWTNAQAARSSTSPLLGALLGLLVAAGLCVGLYRRVLRLNLARFFTVTGLGLVVVVAGVLAYGLRELQDAAVLPGVDSLAFDVSRQVPTGTWWSELVRGVTNLDNRMSWLQVVGYAGYLAVVLTLFLRRSRPPAPAPAPVPPAPVSPAPVSPAPAAVPAAPAPTGAAAGPRPGRVRRPVLAAAVLAVLLPVAAAAVWVVLDRPGPATPATTAVSLTADTCAAEWVAPTTATVTYSVTNSSGRAADVEVVLSSTQDVVAEIEVLGPGTTRSLPVAFGAGTYHWKCRYAGSPTRVSASLPVTGTGPGLAPVTALKRTTPADLAPVLATYRAFVGGQLGTLDRQVAALHRDLTGGDRRAAERDWLAAHLTYRRIGAAYGAFGAAGDAVDGLAQGLPGGTADPAFAGFHRVESMLWSGAPLPSVVGPGAALVRAVAALRARLPEFTFEANDVTVRAHEILEDTLRFTLTGQDDYGSGSGFGTARADLDGSRALLLMLRGLLDQRAPRLAGTALSQMDVLRRALDTAGGTLVAGAPAAVRHRVNAATGQLLETLAPIPDLLEVRAP